MPPHANLERLIGMALVDDDLRTALLRSPVMAATGFGLSSEEIGVLESAHAGSLEELAGHVHAWLSNLPRPRRAPQRRWGFEGQQGARIAV